LLWICSIFYPGFLYGKNTNPWIKKTETDDGIVVYTRSVPLSDIKEAKATCSIRASSLRVYSVIMDHTTYENISEYIQTTEFIPSNEKNVWYIYQRLDLPIVSDRDYTLRYRSVENKQQNYYQVLWEIANNKGPDKQKDVIRITTCSGSLMIQPEARDTTRITYTLYTDPGGYIPDWLANIANQRSIPRLIRAIKDHSISPHVK